LGRAADHQRGGPTVDNATRWVGIDLHRRRSHIAVIDEQGELTTSRRIVNDREAFLELLGGAGETHVALEATYGWEWLAELLEEAGYDLHLAHPLRTRAIASARVKTDAIDARTLAHLLRAGLLPEAYIAPRELRDLRELLRHRATLTRMRSAVKTVCTRSSPSTASRASIPTCLARAAASSSPACSCATRRGGGWTA
jgi:transposase